MTNTSPPRLGGGFTRHYAGYARRWERLPGNVRGAVFAIIAALFHAVLLALIKEAGQALHITQVLFCRQAVMMCFVAPVLARNFPGSLRTSRPGLHLVRVLGALTAMLLSFTALVHLPLAEATTIAFARTFFITIFAILLLGEVVGPRRWLAIAAGFVGVIVVMQPEAATGLDIYALMRLAGAAVAGFVMVIIRKLTQIDQPITIMSYQVIGIGLLMAAPAVWFWKTPTVFEIILLLAIGGISVITQLCNIFAFRAGEASAIAPFDYLRLLFALGLGLLVFAEWPGSHVFLGAGLIIAAALYTLHRERSQARKGASADGDLKR